MVEEARAALPEFRRYLRLKAKLLGITDLGWYDLLAPVGVRANVDVAGSNCIHRRPVRRHTAIG